MKTTASLLVLGVFAIAGAVSSASAQQRLVQPQKPAFKPGVASSALAAQRPGIGFAPSAGSRLVTDNGAGLMNRRANVISDNGLGFRR